MLLVFDAGNMNQEGICRGWACDWIKRSKAGEVIRSRYDMSTGRDVKILYDAAPTNDAVDTAFGLVGLGTVRRNDNPIPALWIAEQLTKGTGHFLFAVRGKMLNIKTGTYDGSGHAMATKKGYGALQFFDPNEGVMEFTNSVEFYEFLPDYIRNTYPDLLSREAEVRKF